MKICVVGVGYVGLVAAACFAEIGHEVSCFDNDTKKISAITAPSMKVSIYPSIKNANAKQNCTSRTNSKTIVFKGNSPIHRQEQRVIRNTLWV